MKHIYYYSKAYFALMFVFIACSAFSQAPQLVNYQAIVRSASGMPVASGTQVSLLFTIHDLTPTGASVFSEVDNDTANQFGLVNVQIGSVNNLGAVNG